MITSSDGSMELIITKPLCLPTALKSHHYYHHESSGYSSKEPQSNSPENKTNGVKLRIHRNKPINNHREQYKIVSNTGSLPIDETLPVRIKYYSHI